MTRRIRTVIFVLMAVLIAPLMVGGLGELPQFGHYAGAYGLTINAIGVTTRHVTNMVSLVNYDIRGIDTLGEETILLAAVTGIIMLLRGPRGETVSADPAPILHRRRLGRSEAVTGFSRIAGPIILLYGIYVVLHAQVTPGGGFQGGVIIFAALLLSYLGEGYAPWRKIVLSSVLDLCEALGAGLYAVGGLVPWLLGATYLQNILPLGKAGSVLSGGLIPIVNLGVGLAVAGGFGSIALEFLEETREAAATGP